MSFNPEIKRLVARHSNGLASVCHHLCLNMCNAAGIIQTAAGTPVHLTREHCEHAIKTYVDEATGITYPSMIVTLASDPGSG